MKRILIISLISLLSTQVLLQATITTRNTTTKKCNWVADSGACCDKDCSPISNHSELITQKCSNCLNQLRNKYNSVLKGSSHISKLWDLHKQYQEQFCTLVQKDTNAKPQTYNPGAPASALQCRWYETKPRGCCQTYQQNLCRIDANCKCVGRDCKTNTLRTK